MRIPLWCWWVDRTALETSAAVSNPLALTQLSLLWAQALEGPWPNADTCETLEAASHTAARARRPLRCAPSGEGREGCSLSGQQDRERVTWNQLC